MGENIPSAASRQRIDKWLFFTRMAKSRSLAQSLVEGGNVRVNGEIIRQSSQQVKPGDRVDIALDRQTKVLIVVAIGDRRGPYEEARKLYEDRTPPPPEKTAMTPFEQAVRDPGAGRPVKKERRALDRLMRDR
jgi:ribosome-associated heat shock protein Hsp15